MNQPDTYLEDQLIDRITAALDLAGVPVVDSNGDTHPVTRAIWAAVADYVRAVFHEAAANGIAVGRGRGGE